MEDLCIKWRDLWPHARNLRDIYNPALGMIMISHMNLNVALPMPRPNGGHEWWRCHRHGRRCCRCFLPFKVHKMSMHTQLEHFLIYRSIVFRPCIGLTRWEHQKQICSCCFQISYPSFVTREPLVPSRFCFPALLVTMATPPGHVATPKHVDPMRLALLKDGAPIWMHILSMICISRLVVRIPIISVQSNRDGNPKSVLESIWVIYS